MTKAQVLIEMVEGLGRKKTLKDSGCSYKVKKVGHRLIVSVEKPNKIQKPRILDADLKKIQQELVALINKVPGTVGKMSLEYHTPVGSEKSRKAFMQMAKSISTTRPKTRRGEWEWNLGGIKSDKNGFTAELKRSRKLAVELQGINSSGN